MQCVILAGGLGTRMAGVAGDLPKTLIPVNGVPFAAHQLDRLAEEGIGDVVYSIGHRGELIRSFVGDGRAWGLRVEYVEDGPTLLGTAGSLRRGLDEGVIAPSFLVLYGDSYLTTPYAAVVRAFEQSGLPALLTVFRNDDQWDRSNVVYEDGKLLLYDKRPERRTPLMRHIEYGLSALTAAALAGVAPGEPADLADVFYELSAHNRLGAYEVGDRFYEIGSPAGLEELERYLASARRGTAPTPGPPMPESPEARPVR